LFYVDKLDFKEKPRKFSKGLAKNSFEGKLDVFNWPYGSHDHPAK